MIQDLPDDAWMLRSELAPAFDALVSHDLVFDALVFPRHLANLATLLSRHPALRTVVDHGAKPAIASGELRHWAAGIATIARETAACCKLSGLVTESGADWRRRPAALCRPPPGGIRPLAADLGQRLAGLHPRRRI